MVIDSYIDDSVLVQDDSNDRPRALVKTVNHYDLRAKHIYKIERREELSLLLIFGETKITKKD